MVTALIFARDSAEAVRERGGLNWNYAIALLKL